MTLREPVRLAWGFVFNVSNVVVIEVGVENMDRGIIRFIPNTTSFIAG